MQAERESEERTALAGGPQPPARDRVNSARR